MTTGETEDILQRIVLEWNRDVRAASAGLTASEARFLVDAYYSIQEHRIATTNQTRTPEGEPNAVLSFLATQVSLLEKRIQSALDTYTSHHPMGEWMRSVHGIGPVISAGLLAHIDITKAPTVGHIWRFAGLDPTRTWIGRSGAEKLLRTLGINPHGKKRVSAELVARAAEEAFTTADRLLGFVGMKTDEPITEEKLASALAKRPWNARLKVLCWKAGESFVKFSGSDKCYYGKVYLERKAWEAGMNEAGAYAEQAKEILATRNISKETEAYKHYAEGKLPPGHLHARAKRVAVKLFLSHMHAVWYELEFKTPPPKPYAIDILGHGHYLPPP